MSLIKGVTPEILIPGYCDKWIKFATSPINPELAAGALKDLCLHSGLTVQRITFIPSPFSVLEDPWLIALAARKALAEALMRVSDQRSSDVTVRVYLKPTLRTLEADLWSQLDAAAPHLRSQLKAMLETPIRTALRGLGNAIEAQLRSQLLSHEHDPIQASLWVSLVDFLLTSQGFYASAAIFDFASQELGIELDSAKLQLYLNYIQHVGWVYGFINATFLCDRPTVHWNDQRQIHASAKPAIEFTDGFCIYAYLGMRIPEKYGKVYPEHWESQWLLSENNVELRRVLIQGIGYARICQELGTVELDSWREYTLLRINANLDSEPVHLLKMICPSTGLVHALRVPPQIETSHEAISWVNWGIPPEDFLIET
jgi:hypothetical protein